jgi:hypothetical protein
VRGIVLWMLLASAGGGLLVAIGLAVAGVGAAGANAGLFGELVPAIIFIGLGMAAPPYIGGILGIVAVGRPPRALRKEQWAAAIGGGVGAFVSPIAFYAGFPALGLVVALIVLLLVGAGYPLLLRLLWKRSAASA